MAKDVASGVQLLTEPLLRRLRRDELEKLVFELDRLLREVRSEQPPLEDIPALQQRNRRIQRLQHAAQMIGHHLRVRKD
jgi:hypothetical protein